MDLRTLSKYPIVVVMEATAMDIHVSRFISEFTAGFVHNFLRGNQSRENKSYDLEKMLRDGHAQSNCFQIFSPNGQVCPLHNEMAPLHVETTFQVECVQGHH